MPTSAVPQQDYEALEVRVKKLESAGSGAAFMQYLAYPLILALIGFYFQHQIENAKDETQRLQIAQSMLASMFAGNHAQALASEQILIKITDKAFADNVNKIVEDYYVSQLKSAVKSNNVDAAITILNATESAGGSLRDKIAAGIGTSDMKVVDSAKLASDKERSGYDDLLSGNFVKALDDFNASEKAYNGFHHSYEIGRLLQQHRGDFDNPVVEKQILNDIATRYWGYIPSDVLQKLRQAVKGQ